MNPIFGVCSDQHLHKWSAFSTVNPDGINNRLQHIIDEIRRAAENTVSIGGQRLYFGGDLFHVRGSVSPTVLNPAIDMFTEIHKELGVECRILTGNHDLESRDSEALSSAAEALRKVPGVTVVSEPTLFDDDRVAMIPWYDSMDAVREKIDEVIERIKSAGARAGEYSLILHAPLNSVIAGIPDHGFYAAELARYGFAHVFCGHYHNFKAFEGNVYSIGATTHQTWNDVGTLAGHLLVHEGIVSHVISQAPRFIDYDASWDDDTAIDQCAGNYVRVRMGEATEEEVNLIRDHVSGLGALGVIVQAIAIPKTTATARTTSVASAPTVRSSINEWIKANSKYGTELETLCSQIMDKVEAVTV